MIVLSFLAQWMVTGYLGSAATMPSSIRVHANGTEVLMNSISFNSRSWQKPLYYGVRGGYRFQRGLGLEAEFIHLKAFAVVPPSQRALVPQFNMSHGANLLLGNFFLSRTLGTGQRFRLTARSGAGISIPHSEAQIGELRIDRYEFGGPAFQIAAGPELRVTRGLAWLSEYKFSVGTFHVGDNNSRLDTRLRTNHWVTGLSWAIGR
jgi:hypothetical protein